MAAPHLKTTITPLAPNTHFAWYSTTLNSVPPPDYDFTSDYLTVRNMKITVIFQEMKSMEELTRKDKKDAKPLASNFTVANSQKEKRIARIVEETYKFGGQENLVVFYKDSLRFEFENEIEIKKVLIYSRLKDEKVRSCQDLTSENGTIIEAKSITIDTQKLNPSHGVTATREKHCHILLDTADGVYKSARILYFATPETKKNWKKRANVGSTKEIYHDAKKTRVKV